MVVFGCGSAVGADGADTGDPVIASDASSSSFSGPAKETQVSFFSMPSLWQPNPGAAIESSGSPLTGSSIGWTVLGGCGKCVQSCGDPPAVGLLRSTQHFASKSLAVAILRELSTVRYQVLFDCALSMPRGRGALGDTSHLMKESRLSEGAAGRDARRVATPRLLGRCNGHSPVCKDRRLECIRPPAPTPLEAHARASFPIQTKARTRRRDAP